MISKKKGIEAIFTLLLLAFCFSQTYGQAQKDKSIAYKWFGKVIGPENTGLYNGFEYIEQHRMVNEKHKFFQSFDFLPATVIYEGIPYYDLDLKYNIFEDLLMVQVENDIGKTTFQLQKAKVDGFSIAGHNFINIPEKTDIEEGFYEVLRENQVLQLLKKHKLEIHNQMTDDYIYHEFTPEKANYFLRHAGSYIPINSKEMLLQKFPSLKQKIIDYYTINNFLLNSNPDLYMANLFLELTSFLSNKKDKEG